MSLFQHPRIDYAVDGTAVLLSTEDAPFPGVELGGEQKRFLNATDGSGLEILESEWESVSTTGSSPIKAGHYMVFLFPRPMRIRGLLLMMRRAITSRSGEYYPQYVKFDVAYSSNASDSKSGTWTPVPSPPQTFLPGLGGVIEPGYRRAIRLSGDAYNYSTIPEGDTSNPSAITWDNKLWSGWHDAHINEWDGSAGVTPVDLRNVTAIRLVPNGYNVKSGFTVPTSGFYDVLGNIFLYGAPETTDRDLSFIGPSPDVRHSVILGSDAPSSSEDTEVHIQNLSYLHTAKKISVSVALDPTTETDPLYARFLLSLDGLSWAPTLSIAEISPRGVSPSIRIRRISGAGTILGPTAGILRATVGRWS